MQGERGTKFSNAVIHHSSHTSSTSVPLAHLEQTLNRIAKEKKGVKDEDTNKWVIFKAIQNERRVGYFLGKFSNQINDPDLFQNGNQYISVLRWTPVLAQVEFKILSPESTKIVLITGEARSQAAHVVLAGLKCHSWNAFKFIGEIIFLNRTPHH